MSLEPYKHYKDSGINWITRMPTSWSIRRVKTLFEIRKRIVGKEGPDVLSVTQQGIRIKDIASNDGQLAMDYSKYQIVEPGDFVMNHMDLLTGWIDIATTSGVTSPDYRVFATRAPRFIHDAYFLYVFQNAYKRKIFYALGQGASHFGRWRLPRASFNDFLLPFPPKDEQVTIADFLDHETATVDQLIDDQLKLVQSLQVRRALSVTAAVWGLRLGAALPAACCRSYLVVGRSRSSSALPFSKKGRGSATGSSPMMACVSSASRISRNRESTLATTRSSSPRKSIEVNIATSQFRMAIFFFPVLVTRGARLLSLEATAYQPYSTRARFA